MIKWFFATLLCWAFLTFLVLPQFPSVWQYLPHIAAFPTLTVVIASGLISAVLMVIFGD